MGYTHYVSDMPSVFDADKWAKLIADCKKASKLLPTKVDEEPLQLTGCYKYKYPQFTKTKIWFNGGTYPRKKYVKGYWVDDPDIHLSHETFGITRENFLSTKKQSFERSLFCKTARKPYDLMVMVVILLMKYYFPEIRIASDGDWNGMWVRGKKFLGEHFPEIAMTLFLDNDPLSE